MTKIITTTIIMEATTIMATIIMWITVANLQPEQVSKKVNFSIFLFTIFLNLK